MQAHVGEQRMKLWTKENKNKDLQLTLNIHTRGKAKKTWLGVEININNWP